MMQLTLKDISLAFLGLERYGLPTNLRRAEKMAIATRRSSGRQTGSSLWASSLPVRPTA